MKNDLFYKGLLATTLLVSASNAVAGDIGVDTTVTTTAESAAIADGINFTADVTYTVDGTDAAQTITSDGAITTDTTNTGAISVTQGHFIANDNIGTSTNALKSISTTTATADFQKVAGDAYVGKVNLADGTFTSTGGTLNVAGGDAGTADLEITAATATLTDTDVNLEDAISIKGAGTLALAGSTTVDAGVKIEDGITGAVNLAGTSQSGDIEVGTGSTLNLTAADDSVAGDITSAGTANIVASGNATIGNIAMTTDGLVSVDSAADTVTLGAITTATDGTGTVEFTKSFDLDNTIGAADKKVKLVDVNGAGLTLTADQAIYANAVNLQGANKVVLKDTNVVADITTTNNTEGTLEFTGTGTVTGKIGADASHALAEVKYTGATSNLNTAIFANAVNLTNKSNVSLAADSAITGNITVNDSTLNLGDNTVAVTGTANATAASTLNSTINSFADFGKLTSTAAATIDADTTVNLNLTDKKAVADAIVAGDKDYTIVHGTGGTAAALTNPAIDNSNLITFTQKNSGTEDLIFTAALDSTFETDNANSVVTPMAKAIDTDILAGDVDSEELFDTFDNIAGLTGAAQTKALTKLLPEVNGASVETTFANQNRIFDAVSTRLNNVATERGLWVTTSYASDEKDSSKGIAGYDADSTSITIGADMSQSATANLGVAFTYTNSDIDTKGNINNKNDVDSYNATVYGSKTFNQGIKLKGLATIGRSNFDSSRNLADLGVGVAKGDYDADTYGVNAEVSKDFAVKGATVTPVIGLAYNKASFDAYTESSAAGLAVNKESFDSLRSKVGVEVSFNEQTVNPEWTAKPLVRASWKHEFKDDSYDYTAKFKNASTRFKTHGLSPEENMLSIGAGVDFAQKAGWKVGVSADADLGSDNTSYLGQLVVSKKF